MNAFEGKVAIVTGGASGIGYALCRELCGRGATVYAADLNPAGLLRLQQDCAGPGLLVVTLNVTEEPAVKALLDRAVREQGRIDYLFNNAGIVTGGDFEHMDFDQWRKIVDINLWGVIYGTQHGYAQMLKQGHGHIVNTASTAGVMPVAKSTAYATTKHAVVGLSVSLREEARKHGIRVSTVVPGLVDTNIFATATNLKGHDYAAAMKKVPTGKISPAQAAGHILDGVAANRQFIVFPGSNRVIVAMNRLLPGFMGWLINWKT
ncbi:SDR family oxidoreductase [Solimonas sp. K1W22B-7]|uniref:SDR family NAD(P)-dependent oxidoreductase n=1 Tax=Solimonas sp. K1W22B-7 TaxID=2303331 RepID=UPI000E330129|nr:SDR family oxidoreductase [Solimonas sp. K1W22B-7]AXQ28738.1 SDR family oxidoreductase [Solimonas sp. K1W22B-7]